MKRINLGILVLSSCLLAIRAESADQRAGDQQAGDQQAGDQRVRDQRVRDVPVVKNGKFADGNAAGWLTTRPEVTVVKLSEPVGDARFAVRFAGQGTKLRRLLYRGKVAVQPGVLYELSFRYRCATRPGIKARFRIASKSHEAKFPAAVEWSVGKLVIPVPPDQREGILDFYYLPGHTGETWLTDIAMVPKGDAGYRTTDE